ncbi:unnamed protein product [Moneuplotes crassus]|uniref:Uncharacterized protein n=1 Tax=Euplotes crassus TaxID=5936 RepID=A0AAD1U9D5_EUPCR|nr:unnamed protein product [Moneuplotes crassus]
MASARKKDIDINVLANDIINTTCKTPKERINFLFSGSPNRSEGTRRIVETLKQFPRQYLSPDSKDDEFCRLYSARIEFQDSLNKCHGFEDEHKFEHNNCKLGDPALLTYERDEEKQCCKVQIIKKFQNKMNFLINDLESKKKELIDLKFSCKTPKEQLQNLMSQIKNTIEIIRKRHNVMKESSIGKDIRMEESLEESCVQNKEGVKELKDGRNFLCDDYRLTRASSRGDHKKSKSCDFTAKWKNAKTKKIHALNKEMNKIKNKISDCDKIKALEIYICNLTDQISNVKNQLGRMEKATLNKENNHRSYSQTEKNKKEIKKELKRSISEYTSVSNMEKQNQTQKYQKYYSFHKSGNPQQNLTIPMLKFDQVDQNFNFKRLKNPPYMHNFGSKAKYRPKIVQNEARMSKYIKEASSFAERRQNRQSYSKNMRNAKYFNVSRVDQNSTFCNPGKISEKLRTDTVPAHNYVANKSLHRLPNGQYRMTINLKELKKTLCGPKMVQNRGFSKENIRKDNQENINANCRVDWN